MQNNIIPDRSSLVPLAQNYDCDKYAYICFMLQPLAYGGSFDEVRTVQLQLDHPSAQQVLIELYL